MKGNKCYMNKKLFLALPLVALLASCNAKGGDSIPSAKKQVLPEGSVVAETDEQKAECYGLLTSSILSVSDNMMVKLHLDTDVKVSGKIEKTNVNSHVKLRGDVSLAFDCREPVTDQRDYYAQIKAEDLSIYAKGLPYEELKGKTLDYSGLDFTVQIIEEYGENVYVRADFSDHELQDAINDLMSSLVPAESIDQMEVILGGILGQKGEDGYRPGIAEVNVTKIVTDINDYFEHQGEEAPIDPQTAAHPIETVLIYLSNLVSGEKGITKYIPMIPAIGQQLGFTVGANPVGEGRGDISFVYNNSIANICKAMGMSAEDMKNIPVKGNVGLLLTVGNTHGSEAIMLEELGVSAGIRYSMEGVTVVGSADLGLSFLYDDMAEFEVLDNEGIVDATLAVEIIISTFIIEPEE